ncbi:MAG: hypothetical protein M3O82_06660, partial [Verrucomicrobiota bacterium]|nr:hypothetical protein [Verrucomicrobiota bacterium]
MKIFASFSTFICAASIALASESTDAQLKSYPKNLARQHLATNLLEFDAKTQVYSPSPLAADWLDDDVSTGAAAPQGHHFFLVALAEPQLLANFAVSAANDTGSVTLYAGDEPAAPGAKSWNLVARKIPIAAINDKTLAKPFSRFAKYLLMETEMPQAANWYGLYLYGEKAAIAYHVEQRAKPIDASALFGQPASAATSLNFSGLYARGRVVYSASREDFISWQRAVDDNPETFIKVPASETESGVVVKFADQRAIRKVAILTDRAAKGRLEIFLTSPAESDVAASDEKKETFHTSELDKISSAVSVEGLTPVTTIQLDGNTPRNGAEFAAVKATQMVLRWTPAISGTPLPLREINSFDGSSLNDYALASDTSAIGELAVDESKDARDFKGGKEALPPIGEFL